MGVIRRQGFKFSIISFVGVGLGVISTMFIYPNALEMVGLFRSLYDASVLAAVLVLLGSPTAAIRFFPKYNQDGTGDRGFLSWLLIVAGCGFGIFLILFPFINSLLIRYIFREENKLYEDFIIYIIPLTLSAALTNLLARYISNFRRIVVPSIFENLTIKIMMPLIILFFLYGWINAEGVVIGVVLSFAFGALGMVWYLYTLGKWKLTKPEILADPEGLKTYSRFSGYGILGSIGSQVAFKIDGLMVAGMIQFASSGLYSIAWALSDVIAKPMRALSAISGPMVAQYIERGEMTELKTLYRKSSLNMSIIGLGLFLLIWTVLPFIFDIMPNSEVMRKGSYVVFFLGLAQLWDMMTGVNNEIITYSKLYRFNLFLILFLAAMNISANFILINKYGMIGAAIATCFSFFIYNLVKLVYIYIKFGFQPLSVLLIPVFSFGVAAWIVAAWIPAVQSPWFTMIYKGGVFSVLYGLAIWKFQLSPDINQWVEVVVGKVKSLKLFTPKSPKGDL
ncbi:MAG TPA: polysaccharide biosynthesis C-terminal domain-containing protein [Saprospiraceae bacterium]|nr:polysaccharide biosynthesis C-terminal domain-containing protein [Saprospiraceae bacterium]